MIFKNTDRSFGIIAILLHWIMALLLVGMVSLGLYMVRLPINPQKLQFYGWHKEFGVLILMLVIVRLSWRLGNKVPSLYGLKRWEIIAARYVHWSFYFFMIASPITGWLMTSSADLPPSFFGWFTLPNLVSANEQNRLFYAEIHEFLAFGLIATFCLHTLAALKHHFLNKDKILRRMLWPSSD